MQIFIHDKPPYRFYRNRILLSYKRDRLITAEKATLHIASKKFYINQCGNSCNKMQTFHIKLHIRDNFSFLSKCAERIMFYLFR